MNIEEYRKLVLESEKMDIESINTMLEEDSSDAILSDLRASRAILSQVIYMIEDVEPKGVDKEHVEEARKYIVESAQRIMDHIATKLKEYEQ